MFKKKILRTVSAFLSVWVMAGMISVSVPRTVQAAGTTYYVDAAGGNDSNTGTSTSTPWKTLAKVNGITFAAGDKILLKSGGVWTNEYLDLHGSGASGNPIVVDYYGGTVKPVINFGDTNVNGEGFGIRLKNVSNWEINHLEITSGQFTTSRLRNGVWVVGEGAGGGNFTHIYIKNVYVHDIFGATRRSGGINFHARYASGGVESTWSDILVDGCTVSNVADTGIQTMTDAYSQASWTHKYDAFTRLIIRNCFVEKIHRDGILTRGANGALVEYNVTGTIGNGAVYNTSTVTYLDVIAVVAAQWPYCCNNAVFQYNEGYGTRKINGDGQAWDFDQYTYHCVYQYNYSHDNDGGALLVMDATDDNYYRFNISQNDKDQTAGKAVYNTSNGSLYVHNNTFYRGSGVAAGSALASLSSGTGTSYYSNNIFYNASTCSYQNGSKLVYNANCFYGANSGVPNDTAKITANPLLTSPGGAGTGISTCTAYKLQSGSPCINAGASLSYYSSGSDFFGGTYPYGSAPDMGAHEYQGVVATPTPTPTPGGTLFSDDFEDGNTTGWTTSGGTWAVATDGSSKVMTSTSAADSLAVAGNAWTAFTCQARVKVTTASGNAGLVFRYGDASNYYLARINDSNDKVELYKKSGGTMTSVASYATTLSSGTWYTLKVSVSGNTVQVWLNGSASPVISWTNSTTELTSGKIGFRAASSTASFDDVTVN